jgi:GNAT superfamily N-acetyltransferase
VNSHVVPMRAVPVSRIIEIAHDGTPFVRPRGESDYWLYGRLFSSTCAAAIHGDVAVGFIVAFRSQDEPDNVYIQDVAVLNGLRGRGHGRSLVEHVAATSRSWGVRRLWLTSEAENKDAHRAWLSMGFVNSRADYQVDGVWVTTGLKGPGRDRAVYERLLG